MNRRGAFSHPVFGRPDADSSWVHAWLPPVSLIDVVVLLLIFLLAQFPLAEGLLSISSAKPAGRDDPPPQRLWIHVQPGADGTFVYRLNDWPATSRFSQLVGHVHDWVRSRGAGNLAVVIGAEPGVPFEKLVELWEACRKLGIDKLALPEAG